MTLAKFVEYIKVHLTWKNKPDQSTPILGEHMMTIESGIKANNEAIQELAAAVVSQITNDPNKIASMAALYSVNKKADDLISDLEKQYALADTTYVTDFNNASIAGRYRIYNASGSAAHGPYSGAVEGYVDILTDGNINTTGTKVYQTLHDYLGDVYTRVNVAGTSYGTWKKLTP